MSTVNCASCTASASSDDSSSSNSTSRCSDSSSSSNNSSSSNSSRHVSSIVNHTQLRLSTVQPQQLLTVQQQQQQQQPAATFFRDGLHTILSFLSLTDTCAAAAVNRHWYTCTLTEPCKSIEWVVSDEASDSFFASLTSATTTAPAPAPACMRHITDLDIGECSDLTVQQINQIARLTHIRSLILQVNERMCTYFERQIQQQQLLQQQQRTSSVTCSLQLPSTLTCVCLHFPYVVVPSPVVCAALFETIAAACTRLQTLKLIVPVGAAAFTGPLPSLSAFERSSDLRTLALYGFSPLTLQHTIAAIRTLPHITDLSLDLLPRHTDRLSPAAIVSLLLDALDSHIQQAPLLWAPTLKKLTLYGCAWTREVVWTEEKIRRLAHLLPHLNVLPIQVMNDAVKSETCMRACATHTQLCELDLCTPYVPSDALPPLSASTLASIVKEEVVLRRVTTVRISEKQQWSSSEWMSVLSQFDRLTTLTLDQCAIPSFTFIQQLSQLTCLTLQYCTVSVVQMRQLADVAPTSLTELHWQISVTHAGADVVAVDASLEQLLPKRIKIHIKATTDTNAGVTHTQQRKQQRSNVRPRRRSASYTPEWLRGDALLFVSVEAAAPTYEISFNIDLRNYEIPEAPQNTYSVYNVSATGARTSLGSFPGRAVAINNLQLLPRQILYLTVEQDIKKE